MATLLVTHDNITGDCELSPLRPYPVVTSSDTSVTVTSAVDAVSGQTTFDLEVAAAVETLTSLIVNNDGSFTFTNEDDMPVIVTACSLLSNLPVSATLVG